MFVVNDMTPDCERETYNVGIAKCECVECAWLRGRAQHIREDIRWAKVLLAKYLALTTSR